jgi:nucleotide-binding universal stress UspA family protein
MDQGRQCTGKSKRSGKRCKRGATPGLDKCYIHAGISRDQQQVIRAMATYGGPRDVAPAEALLEEVQMAAGHVAWLRAQVAALEPDALTWGVSEIAVKAATEFRGTDVTERAALNVWLEAYHRERRYLLDVCKAALAAGCEERRVRVAEAYGMQLAGAITTILRKLGLTPDQHVIAGQVVPETLRELAAVPPSPV